MACMKPVFRWFRSICTNCSKDSSESFRTSDRLRFESCRLAINGWSSSGRFNARSAAVSASPLTPFQGNSPSNGMILLKSIRPSALSIEAITSAGALISVVTQFGIAASSR
ncbi:hypothetical protein FQZ97_1020370 [compost metagenome]